MVSLLQKGLSPEKMIKAKHKASHRLGIFRTGQIGNISVILLARVKALTSAGKITC